MQSAEIYNRINGGLKGIHLALGLLLLSVWDSSAETRATNASPNIVFILADDLGHAEIGPYGQTNIQTPNIDRLAAQGMRFTQCYSGSHVCAPSRSALMTGLHTGHTPVRANGGERYLYDEDMTIAEVLKGKAYAAGGFGKWGLGTETSPGFPLKQGFDEWFGYYHQVHAHFYYPYYLWRNGARYPLPENEGHKRSRYSHDEIHKQALAFIRAHKDQRFFAYVPYTLPHVELTVPDDSLQPYRGKWKEKPLADSRAGYIGADEPYATHAAMISRLDRSVGEILTLLQELGLDDQTIVFFSSDNGPQGGHWQRVADFFTAKGSLRGYKGDFYEGGIRVPLLVRWPGHVKPGTITDHLCAFWDFLPTFAELAGAEVPPGLDGISFAPTLLGGEQRKIHEFLYWEYGRGTNLTQAVRMRDWKAIRAKKNGALELYHLGQDPTEKRNLADAEPAVVDKILKLMTSERTEERDYPPDTPHPPREYVR